MASEAQLSGRIQNGLGETTAYAVSNADFAIIGDTEHQNTAVRDAVSSQELIAGLAQGGFSVIALEFPKLLDGFAQEYMSSNGTPEDAAKFRADMNENFKILNQGEVTQDDMINSVVNTMDAAKKYEMDVRFIDTDKTSFIFEPLETAAYAVNRYAEEFGESPQFDNQDYVANAVSHGFDNGYYTPEQEAGLIEFSGVGEPVLRATQWYTAQTGAEYELTQENITTAHKYAMENNFYTEDELQRLDDYGQKIIDIRTDDTEITGNIIEASNGQKTAVIIGNAHDDLATKLPGQSVIIDIYENREAFDKTSPSERPGFKPEGEPDFVYMAEEKEMFVTSKAEPALTAGLTEIEMPAQADQNMGPVPNAQDPSPVDPLITPRTP